MAALFAKSQAVKKAYVVGMKSVREELEGLGIGVLGSEQEVEVGMPYQGVEGLDKDVDAVVIGLDEKFTYRKLCMASLYA